MKRSILFLSLCIFYFFSFSQIDFNNYQIQRCVGSLPKGFNAESSVKAQEKMDEIDNMNIKPKEKDLRKQHVILTTFLIDAFLTSGDVLFGDPMTDYVSRVADHILEQEPVLRGELQFFILKSNTPNALATGNGMIFVTTGLLARIENEAQLAFILCHEIQHYKLKHSLLQYKQARKLEEEGRYADLNTDQKIRKFYHFSILNESEADAKGYALFATTRYAKNQPVKAFENTKYFDYPFLDIKLDYKHFEDSVFRFDSIFVRNYNKKAKSGGSLYKETGFITEKSKKGSGSYSKMHTHPSLETRIEAINKLMGKDTSNGVLFYLSESEFRTVQRQARCEELYLQIRAADFGNSYYLAVAMDSAYGKTLYTQRIKAMSLYGLAKHKVRQQPLIYYGCYYNKAKGNWRDFKCFNTILDIREMECLVAHELWKLASNQNDTFIAILRDDIFKELVTKCGLSYLRIITEANSNSWNIEESYYRFFGEDLKNQEFIAYVKEQDKNEYYYDDPDKQKKKLKKKNSLNKKLKLNSILMFDPEYSCYLHYSGGFLKRATTKRDFFREEEFKASLSENFENAGAQNNMQISYISNAVGSKLTTESLNEYSIMRDWILERIFNDTISFITFTNPEANQISKRYDIPNIALSVMEENRFKNEGSIGGRILLSIILPPFIPYIWFRRPITEMYVMVFNIQEDRIEKFNSKYTKGKFTEKKYKSYMMKQIHRR